ncbi:Hypothetical predicted protein [Podarcis lilfordi]|uniref:Uncharacterized protein n=1 Tax=Podarcis lilfordi TaxID=74358 RepID=A0AA35JQW8_9SAUR|nr:Hypothetical predicted protein [Podarcis lilfordi]
MLRFLGDSPAPSGSVKGSGKMAGEVKWHLAKSSLKSSQKLGGASSRRSGCLRSCPRNSPPHFPESAAGSREWKPDSTRSRSAEPGLLVRRGGETGRSGSERLHRSRPQGKQAGRPAGVRKSARPPAPRLDCSPTL